jgi:hypothetical protein
MRFQSCKALFETPCIILTVFPLQSYCTKAPHCYVTRTLPVVTIVTERYSGLRAAYYGVAYCGVRRKSPLILSEGNYGM